MAVQLYVVGGSKDGALGTQYVLVDYTSEDTAGGMRAMLVSIDNLVALHTTIGQVLGAIEVPPLVPEATDRDDHRI